jgi:hypothetical protein
MICRYELKEYRNKTENQITPYQDDKQHNAAPRRRTTQRSTQTTKSQQQKITKRLDLCENHLFRLKVKSKKRKYVEGWWEFKVYEKIGPARLVPEREYDGMRERIKKKIWFLGNDIWVKILVLLFLLWVKYVPYLCWNR